MNNHKFDVQIETVRNVAIIPKAKASEQNFSDKFFPETIFSDKIS